MLKLTLILTVISLTYGQSDSNLNFLSKLTPNQSNLPYNLTLSHLKRLSKRQIGGYFIYNGCSNIENADMKSCEVQTASYWETNREDKYDYDDRSSRKFCCQKWDELKCKLKVLWKCDDRAARQTEQLYEQQYNSLCYWHSRRSASCVLRWWSITLIVIGGLILVVGIGLVVFRFMTRNQRRYRYA